MKLAPEILFEWHAPREIIEYDANRLRSRSRKVIPFTLIMALLIEMVLLIPSIVILYKYGPEFAALIPSFVRRFVIAGIIIALGTPLLLYVIQPMLLKRKKVCYQITPDVFVIKTDSVRKIRWEKMRFIGTIPHEELSDYQFLNLFYQQTKLSIPLPEPDLSEKIVSYISSKTQPLTDVALIQNIVISPKQNLCLSFLSVLYIGVFVFIVYNLKHIPVHENAFILSLLPLLFISCILFLGPGTLGMIFFYRSLLFRRKDLKQYALQYNFLALLFALCICTV
ncbi:MAG: hypothetical protein L0Y36_10635 [Planctomycetales bacterium]|nr:hypothetical protein [Planctomycetales bacterium]